MKILALSDRVVESIYSEHIRQNFGDVDLVIGCGDLPYYYLEYIVSMLNQPAYFVRGNHDAGVQYTSDGRRLTGPQGAESLEDRLVRLDGLLLMGLGGSMRYKSGVAEQYTEAEMRLRALRMLPGLLVNRLRYGRFVDIIVTHSPPYRIHDRHDRAHTGFKVFRALMAHFHPRYLLHGHAHIWRRDEARKTTFHNTTVVNVYPAHVLDIAPPQANR